MKNYETFYSPGHTPCYNPATGKIYGYSPLTGTLKLKEIIKEARTAQDYWAELPIGERVKYIIRIRDYLVKKADNIAEVISIDNGKTKADALVTEVLPSITAASYYARQAKKFLRDRRIRPGSILFLNKRSKIIRVPYGIIGIISPWNYPFSIPFSEVIMGLLAGNAVILKVATETQMVGRKLEECFLSAGLPKGVFTYVNIPGRLAGDAFLEYGIDKLFFTGSVDVGKKLMSKAAETITPLVLELGGNDAMLVCGDADLYRAASGAAWAGLVNCGQSCGGVERIYVHDRVYEPFMRLLAERVKSLRVGQELGVMTTERQIKAVEEHLRDALAKGAVVYAQSEITESDNFKNVFPATVLTEVTHDMLVMREETFGPVLAVMKVSNMDEAIALANDSDFGLTGSVWSKNRRFAENLARRIQAGVIMVNDHLMSHGLPETPWGGFKQSGIGRTHGAQGFDEMTQTQVLVHDILSFARKNMWWYPYDEKLRQRILGTIKFFYGKFAIRRYLISFNK